VKQLKGKSSIYLSHLLPEGVVVWKASEPEPEADKLAQRIGIPLRTQEEPPDEEGVRWVLFFEDHQLFLVDHHHPEMRPFALNFLSPDLKRRWKDASKNDLLPKAIGIKKGIESVCDLTGGLALDAFLLASFRSMEVFVCERNPVIAEITMNALLRLRDHTRLSDLPLRFHVGDGVDFLQQQGSVFDCVYLDPMFEEDGSALPGKEMQVLRALVGDTSDPPARLWEAAWNHAKKRVVVKRSSHGPALPGVSREPDFQLSGKRVRFDVYLKGAV
jgi:16S rRNA (guanine1516-N2)-methyltransferase